jgi:hypothetical protein
VSATYPDWTGNASPIDDLMATAQSAAEGHARAVCARATDWLDGLHDACVGGRGPGTDYVIDTLSGKSVASFITPLADDRIDVLNFALPGVVLAMLPIEVAVALLMETFRSCNRLPSRAAFVSRVEAMTRERVPDRAERIIRGLR